MFGLSVKDLETRNVIARCNSSGDLYPFFPPATSTSAFLVHPPRYGTVVLGILGMKFCPNSLAPKPSRVIKMIVTIYVMRVSSVDTLDFHLVPQILELQIISI